MQSMNAYNKAQQVAKCPEWKEKQKGKLATANVSPRRKQEQKRKGRKRERRETAPDRHLIAINQIMICYHTYDKLAPPPIPAKQAKKRKGGKGERKGERKRITKCKPQSTYPSIQHTSFQTPWCF
jgi:hypothetical protein